MRGTERRKWRKDYEEMRERESGKMRIKKEED